MLSLYLSMLDTEDEKSKFDRLYEKYWRLMLYAAKGILKNEQDAEDCLHEAYIKVIKNIHNIGEIDCHETRNYLVIIIRGICFDFLAKKSRQKNDFSLESVDEIMENGISPQEKLENSELAVEMSKCMLCLPERYSTILLLKYDNDLSTEEIAEVLEISHDNVRKVLSRAKAALATELKKGGYDRYAR